MIIGIGDSVLLKTIDRVEKMVGLNLPLPPLEGDKFSSKIYWLVYPLMDALISQI